MYWNWSLKVLDLSDFEQFWSNFIINSDIPISSYLRRAPRQGKETRIYFWRQRPCSSWARRSVFSSPTPIRHWPLLLCHPRPRGCLHRHFPHCRHLHRHHSPLTLQVRGSVMEINILYCWFQIVTKTSKKDVQQRFYYSKLQVFGNFQSKLCG